MGLCYSPEEVKAQRATDIVTHTDYTLLSSSDALRSKVGELAQAMLSQGIIEPSRSLSPKEGRGAVLRGLNRVTKLDEFPLPRTHARPACWSEIFHHASGCLPLIR